MAWLQNWAERAEDLLNKIDQNAANVLLDGTLKRKSDDTETYQLQPEHVSRSALVTPSGSKISLQSLRSRSDSAILEETSQKEPHILTRQESLEDIRDVGISFSAPSESKQLFSKKSVAGNGSKLSPAKVLKKTMLNSSPDSSVSVEDAQLYIDRIANLEAENQELNKQLLNLQHSYLQLRNENSLLQTEAKTAQSLASDLKQDMEMYRARAHKMLKEMKSMPKKSGEDCVDNDVYVLQIKGLNEEIEFQTKKNEELSESLRHKTSELTNLQQQFNYMKSFWQQNSQTLEGNLTDEKKIREVAEEECKMKTRKLQSVLQELHETKNLIEAKQQEISHLKQSIEVMNTYRSNEDLESRIQSLTQTLMFKQSSLETVQTERNALRLQLEKAETEYKSKLAEMQRKNVQVVNVNDDHEGSITHVPRFMRLSPRDAGVTRRVKRAYSTLDAIMNQTGALLRRYPFARVCIFYYVVLLHIWVLFILFIDAPSSL